MSIRVEKKQKRLKQSDQVSESESLASKTPLETESVERIKVLYVDDEIENLRSFKACFRREFEVEIALSGAEGLQIFRDVKPDVVITDQRMPQMTGIELLEELQKVNSAPMRMLLTGYSDISAVIHAINRGQVYRYLTKPWNETELRNAIHSAYEVYDLRKRNAELLRALERANDQLEFLLRQKLLS